MVGISNKITNNYSNKTKFMYHISILTKDHGCMKFPRCFVVMANPGSTLASETSREDASRKKACANGDLVQSPIQSAQILSAYGFDNVY